MILTYEELVASRPRSTIKSIYEWLGVDVSFTPENAGKAEHVTPADMDQAAGFGLLHRLRKSRMYSAIEGLVPRPVQRVGSLLATRRVNRESVPVSDVIAFLRPVQMAQTEELRSLLGRDFPEWSTLYGD